MVKDDNVCAQLDKNSKKLFVLLTENYYKDNSGMPFEITNNEGIDDENIETVKQIVLEKFPNSLIEVANLYPCAQQVEAVCKAAIEVEEVIFVTYSACKCYSLGGDFTPRIIYLMEAVKDKLAGVIHIGNPYPLEAIPHVPRIIISVGGRENSIEKGLAILNGEYMPKGKLPFKLTLK